MAIATRSLTVCGHLTTYLAHLEFFPALRFSQRVEGCNGPLFFLRLFSTWSARALSLATEYYYLSPFAPVAGLYSRHATRALEAGLAPPSFGSGAVRCTLLLAADCAAFAALAATPHAPTQRATSRARIWHTRSPPQLHPTQVFQCATRLTDDPGAPFWGCFWYGGLGRRRRG